VKYMLLIYGDEKALDDIEREQCYVKSTELAHDSEAIDIATRIPMARLGTVEVRPVIEIPGLPKS